MTDLLNCPFCGKAPQLQDFLARGTADYVEISCGHPVEEGPDGFDAGSSCASVTADTLELAIAAWNRRSTLPVGAETGEPVADPTTNDFAIKDAVWLDGLAFSRSGEEASRLRAIAHRIRTAAFSQATASSPVSAEPVAWRWPHPLWPNSHFEFQIGSSDPGAVEGKQPLYAAPPRSDKANVDWVPTHKHRKRGSTYRVLTKDARLQWSAYESTEAEAGALTVYQAEDGSTWVRPTAEFNDGRFEALSTSPAVPNTVGEDKL